MPFRSLLILVLILCSCKHKKLLPAGERISQDSLMSVHTPIADKKIWPKVLYDTLKFSDGPFQNSTTSRDSLNELHFYKKFIQSKNLGKDRMVTEEYSSQRIRYLGTLNDLDNIHAYHVLTNFTKLGINGHMLSPRGHSTLVFVDREKKMLRSYQLSMPNELPKRIDNNQLYFEVDGVKGFVSLSGGLPQIFCVPGTGCY